MSWKLVSLAGLGLMVAAAVALVFRHALVSRSPAAISLQALAVLEMLWARKTLGLRSFHATAGPTSGELVTRGPYRFLRNPIYSAALLFLAVGVATHFSPLHMALWIAAAAGVGLRIAGEERLLRERYPEYASYAARTKRLIPFVF